MVKHSYIYSQHFLACPLINPLSKHKVWQRAAAPQTRRKTNELQLARALLAPALVLHCPCRISARWSKRMSTQNLRAPSVSVWRPASPLQCGGGPQLSAGCLHCGMAPLQLTSGSASKAVQAPGPSVLHPRGGRCEPAPATPHPLLPTTLPPCPEDGVSLELARVCRRSAPPSRLASQQKSFSYREQFRSKKKRTEAAELGVAAALGQAPGVRRRGRYAGTRDFVLHVCLTLSFTAVMVGSRDQYGHAFSTSIKRQLLDTELPYLESEIAQLAPSDSQVGKRFEQISTLAEVHRFLQGALRPLSTLHPFRHAPPLRHATAPSPCWPLASQACSCRSWSTRRRPRALWKGGSTNRANCSAR